jgi:hypothetical protein
MSFDVQGEGGPVAGAGMRNIRVANGFGAAQGWRGEVNTTASYVTQSVSEASALPAQQAELLQAPTTPYALTNAPSSGQAVGGYRTLQAAPASGFQTFQGTPYGGFQTFQGNPSAGFQAIQGRPFAGGRGFTQAQGSVQDEQLAEHQETLRTDLDAVVGESAVTDGQRWAFKKDVRSLAEAGLPLDPEALSSVADGLLTAIADGSFEANQETIRGEFAATFTESSDDSDDSDALSDKEVALVNQTFDHFVAIAKGLNLTTDKLDVLTADRKAIQDDLERLEISTTGTPAPDSNLDLILSPNQGSGARFVRARP